MTQDRWLLPEGIQEALPAQAERLEHYRRKLLDLYKTWGYELVMPPFIEYLESLFVATGKDLDLQTFKLTDQLTGRMMGVRSDMTPQVARIDAHMLKRDVPTRLCYMGTVLRARPEAAAGSRSPLQLGAEIYGHAGLDSDVEIIRLMLETLRATGVDRLHMDIGHVGIYASLAQQARLDEAQEAVLFDMLQRKAMPEIAAYLDELRLGKHEHAMLLALAELNGGDAVLAEARTALKKAGKPVLRAIDYVEQVAQATRRYAKDVEIHFDFAELRGYQYQTGIVFAAFVPGRGQEIARGGRYDEIGKVFGRARPATGFSADLKTLIDVSSIAQHSKHSGILVAEGDVEAAREEIDVLRASGERVICALSGQQATASAMGCDRELVLDNNQWIVRTVS